jgi:dephospho-CoA kinase
MLRDNANEEQIMNRIKNQLTDEERAQLSDFILVNDERRAVIPQMRGVLRLFMM